MKLSDADLKLIWTALNAQADRFAEMASARDGAARDAQTRNAEMMRDLARKVMLSLELETTP